MYHNFSENSPQQYSQSQYGQSQHGQSQYGQTQYGQQNHQNQQQNQQPLMMEPPQFVSNKDLLYLSDAMSWELLAMKKCNHFAQETSSSRMKQVLNKSGRMHQQHYERLLKHVKPGQRNQQPIH